MPGSAQRPLTEALERYGRPEIFNTDQGSRFTSLEFTSGLKDAAGVAISMDGRGRRVDNIFIERLWRSLKYGAVYLHEFSDGFAATRFISRWVSFCDNGRPRGVLGGCPAAEPYEKGVLAEMHAEHHRSPASPTGASETRRRAKRDTGGMIDYCAEYTLSLPLSCPPN